MIEERDLELARQHPRGTERRTLLPYRDSLQDPHDYAKLPADARDEIVRWAEIRRRIRERGVDHDPANLADPLIPHEKLRALVLEGERIARGVGPFSDEGGDLLEVVARIRAS